MIESRLISLNCQPSQKKKSQKINVEEAQDIKSLKKKNNNKYWIKTLFIN